MTVEDFIFQIAAAALMIAVWADVARLHKKLRELDAYVKYIYYMLYYQHYSPQPGGGEEEKEEEGDEDVDKAKESCVLELVSKRGCVNIEEAVELCGVSKSFIINRLYRKRKVVKVDREYKTVCPK
jgi:hypothetical protein